ncbi:TonB-dependent receptor [Minwuia thermotolerans]|uniref:Ligand-gated channel n=1 Tax=Minwuia thermotolerans TaxID=2056226 RepID=A0A2M9G576_9PROT|nr:TonB-dependent receptor [Minwuia thermotolerans]PJK30879.1 ligand-gated channel [Minwuia thermotolerans]
MGNGSIRSIAMMAALAGMTVTSPLQAQQNEEDNKNVENETRTEDSEAAETLPPVVISATRRETPVSELTRSVTLVDEEDVNQQKRIDRSLGEILSKTVPGFSQSTEALTDFGQTLRGRTFLTLIDGIPQTTPLRDGRRSLNSIDPDAIERVEVVRGGTAAYGFGATGGLVNVITKRPGEGEFEALSEAGAKLSATHPEDSLEWHIGQQFSGREGDVDYLLNGTFVQRNGRFDASGDRIPADPFGVQGGLSDTDEFNVLGKVGYTFGNDNERRLELTANHFNIFQDSEFAGLGNGDASERIETPAVRGNINARDPGTRNTTVNLEYRDDDVYGSGLDAQVYYGDLLTRFSKFPGFEQVEIISEKIGSRLTIDTPVSVMSQDLDLIWGVDYLHDTTEQIGIDGPTTTPRMDQHAFAGFAQVEAPVTERILIRAGVRHEYIRVDIDDVLNRQGVFVQGDTLHFNETLFNASANVTVTDYLDIYGGFSQGFSLADIGRAIADTTQNNAAALQSEAQTVDNFELGLRLFGDAWDTTITGFYSRSDNGTTFDQNLVIAKQAERIWGVEASANADVAERLSVGGTFTWMAGKVDLDEDGDFEEDLDSTRIPPVKITAFAEYSPFDWWRARLQGLYSGNRAPDSTQFGNGPVRDYIVFDLYSAFDVGPGELVFGVENLLNSEYFPVLNQAGALDFAFSRAPGMTVSATYSVKW